VSKAGFVIYVPSITFKNSSDDAVMHEKQQLDFSKEGDLQTLRRIKEDYEPGMPMSVATMLIYNKFYSRVYVVIT
jgi:hypothetical protein